ncbi:MAG TPA: AAA family ATPase, partial [bacterium]|nr:AAA family ATPase [bacterium]
MKPGPRPRGFTLNQPVAVTGTVERITFENPDSGYVVARFRSRATGEILTLVGSLGGIKKGEELEVQGVWELDGRYGPQVSVKKYTIKTPTEGTGLREYLTTFKGIGPRRAKLLADHFGDRLAEVMDKHPQELTKIKGITRPLADSLWKEWHARAQERQVMVYCHSHGLTPNQGQRIFREYGERALHVLNSNPYRLAEEVYGIGFKKADEIAGKLGIGESDPIRVQAALVYTLSRAAEDGHMYLPAHQLLKQAHDELGIKQGLPEALAALIREKRVKRDDGLVHEPLEVAVARESLPGDTESLEPGLDLAQVTNSAIYLPFNLKVETEIARELALKLATYKGEQPLPPEWEAALQLHLRRQQIDLSEEQQAAVRTALTSPVTLLTGGPGTGKSTCLKLAVDVLESQRRLVTLCAPTGRAAKRLSETTGRAALTIHRLLEFAPTGGGFQRGRERPIDAEIVIVDEVSMLDSSLCAALLRALPPRGRLILVGDPDQLPSVGAGNVLADLIDSGAVPRAHLTQIYRQAQTSQIVVNAHRINAGEMPSFSRKEGQKKDFIFKQVTDDKHEGPGEAAHLVIETVTKGFAAEHFDPIRMVQVLTPMHSG